ncbi:MAG: glucose-6-phosphate dehydrogenase [Verrucomicrobiae bacterium]|nr:glucose-6-phosphate dehydrogenase [Verrucomicrobiae bacterium]
MNPLPSDTSNPGYCELDGAIPLIPPSAAVIFGATGDLAHKKIFPAFYQLMKNRVLPEGFTVVGVARRPKDDGEFRRDIKESIQKLPRLGPFDETAWNKLAENIFYHQGDLSDPASCEGLNLRLKNLPGAPAYGRNHLFYLAISPNHFGEAAARLAAAGLAPDPTLPGFRRLIVEKPFGVDLASARQLNRELLRHFPESSLYRIDHYLGKETVQNLLFLRFANAIFEPLWNRRYIDNVQITASEHIGIENRGEYYDKAGALRDIVQNHLLQLLMLTAMEPPVSLEPESIRDEKVKVLRCIPPLTREEAQTRTVRAQYINGIRNGQPAAAYRQEARVAPASNTETFAALRLEIDNWRWKGVPFYLRAGKSLQTQYTEIAIVFNRPPGVLFAAACGMRLRNNTLRIHIQPNEGIHFGFNAKIPARQALQKLDMNFHYSQEFNTYLPEAYERLLIDALAGENTLFIRSDEVEYSWQLIDRIRQAWDEDQQPPLAYYPCGSPGPKEADDLLARDNREWVPYA